MDNPNPGQADALGWHKALVDEMPGGSEPHLFETTEGPQVIKAGNNPQGTRVLPNELVGGLLLDWLGVNHPKPHVVRIPPEVIQDNPGAKFRSGTPLASGLAFGSPFWQSDPQAALDPKKVRNKADVAGTLSYDTWVRNHDARQFRVRPAADEPGKYDYIPVDQGHSLGNPNWTAASLDADRTVVVPESLVPLMAQDVAPLITRLREFDGADADGIIAHAPPDWLTPGEREALKRYLVERAPIAADALQAKYPSTGG